MVKGISFSQRGKLTPILFQKITLSFLYKRCWSHNRKDRPVPLRSFPSFSVLSLKEAKPEFSKCCLSYLMLCPPVLVHIFRKGSSTVAYRDCLPVFASNCISPPRLWTPDEMDVVFFFFSSTFGHRLYNFHFVAAVS